VNYGSYWSNNTENDETKTSYHPFREGSMKPFEHSAASRAQEVRSRRSQHLTQKAASAGSRAYKPVQTAPVFARSSAYSIPASGVQNRSKVRRKLYYSLDAAGTEIQLPALPLIQPGPRLISGAIVLLFGAIIIAFLSMSSFQVSKLTISGLSRLSAADVQTVMALDNLPVVMIDPQIVKAELTKAFPDLTNINVSISLPASVKVTVKERQPVLVWSRGDQTQWIDSEGAIFPVRGDVGQLLTIQSEENPPLVASSSSTAKLASLGKAGNSQTSQTMDLSVLTAAQKLRLLAPADTTLIYSSQNGLGWNDPQGWKVFIGLNLDDMDTKMAEYQAIVKQLTDQGIKPQMVSVEHVHAPFYRMEQ
jgi:cell division septal protein FtsQ